MREVGLPEERRGEACGEVQSVEVQVEVEVEVQIQVQVQVQVQVEEMHFPTVRWGERLPIAIRLLAMPPQAPLPPKPRLGGLQLRLRLRPSASPNPCPSSFRPC